MTKTEMKNKADELWAYFEENLFVNKGYFPYNTNLVFAFADYIDSVSDDCLSEFLNSDKTEDIAAFRKMLKRGVDLWLEQFSKIMAIM